MLPNRNGGYFDWVGFSFFLSSTTRSAESSDGIQELKFKVFLKWTAIASTFFARHAFQQQQGQERLGT